MMVTPFLASGLSPASAAAAQAVPAASAESAVRSGAGAVAERAAVSAAAGSFQALLPSRVLDTRTGVGAVRGALAGGQSLGLQVAGRGGVPSTGVAAVALNVTATGAARPGFLTVYPDGGSRPGTSNVNFVPGRTSANVVVVPISTYGRIRFFNGATSGVQVVADVAGYYLAGTPAAAGTYRSVSPTRLLDTRSGLGAAALPVASSRSLSLQVTGRAPVPASGVSAVLLNVTVTSPSAAGFLTIYPDGKPRPTASNLNFTPGQTVPNMVVATVGSNGRIALYNGSAGIVDVVVDVAGYYLAGFPSVAGALQAVPSTRVADTRTGLATAAQPIAASGSLALQIAGPGTGGVLAWGVAAVVMNVTVTAPDGGGYLTVYPNGKSKPATSNLAFAAHQTVASLVVVPVGSDGRVRFANGSGGNIDLIVDVVGVFFDGSLAAGELRPGQTLGSGGQLRTADGLVLLTLQSQGDLVLTRSGSQVWRSNTAANPGARLVMQTDGNLVLRSTSGRALWNSGTPSHPGAGMGLVTNGSFTVALANATLWASRSTVYGSCDTVARDPAGTAITRWDPITLCVLASLNQSSGNLSDVNIIIEYESSGDPNAINNWDLNFQAGHPSEGLIQVIQPTFDTYRSPELANDLLDPAANLYVGLNYAIHTYGSIHNVPGLVSLRNGGGYKGYIIQR